MFFTSGHKENSWIGQIAECHTDIEEIDKYILECLFVLDTSVS